MVGRANSEGVLRLHSRETVYKRGKVIPRNKSDTGMGKIAEGRELPNANSTF